MNLLLPRSDRRRFFLLSDFQSNALHGDINETLKNAPATLLFNLDGGKTAQQCRHSPPHLPLRQRIPLKTLLEASSDPSPATNNPQNVAGGLLLSLSSNNNPQNVAADLLLSISGNEYPSKRRRRPPLIPLRKHKPLKTLPQDSSDPSPATKTPQNVAAGRGGNSDPSVRHLF